MQSHQIDTTNLTFSDRYHVGWVKRPNPSSGWPNKVDQRLHSTVRGLCTRSIDYLIINDGRAGRRDRAEGGCGGILAGSIAALAGVH